MSDKKMMDPGLIAAIMAACLKVIEWIYDLIMSWINKKDTTEPKELKKTDETKND